MRRSLERSDGSPRRVLHGTVSGYVNLRCRCDDCRRAQSQYMHDYNKRRDPWRASWRVVSQDASSSPGVGEVVGRGIEAMVEELKHQGREVDAAISRSKTHARRSKSVGRFTSDEWLALVATYEGRCAYCGVRPEILCADHRTPLARGGTNTIDNILPACRSCNAHKYTKTEAEFRAWL